MGFGSLIEQMFAAPTRFDAPLSAADLAREDAVIDRLMTEYEACPPVPDAAFLPEGLEDWPADPILALLLSRVDLTGLSGRDRVRYLQAQERLNAAGSAATMAALHSVSDAYDQLSEDIEDPEAGASMETRAALGWTRRTADTNLALAHDLIVRLPAVFTLLKAGRIDLARARVIIESTSHLSIAHARAVVGALTGEALRLTTGQLRVRLRRLCLQVDPDSVRQQQDQAVADRQFASWTEADGTLSLLLTGLDPVRGQEIFDRISRIARHHKTSDETRTMDQLRADIAADLLAGATDTTIGQVHLSVDLTALFDPDVARTAELAGYGPVLADITTQARRQFEDAGWDWTVHLPHTFAPVADGHTRRRPTTSQKRRLRARYRTCIAPGCRRAAINSDIDHTRPWAETGTTNSDDLGPLCRPDHCTRHQAGWNYQHLDDGNILWSSPLGTTYTVTGTDPP